MTLTGL